MPFHYPSFNKHLSFSKRDKSKLIRNRVRTESMDGSGNFKITKFFQVKTGKCRKFSTFVVITQSSIEFSNSIVLQNILTRNCGKYFRRQGRVETAPRPQCVTARMLKPFSNQTIHTQYIRFSYIYGMLYCSSECGSILIMRSYAQLIATRMYIHFMCAYVYLHLHLFVIPLIY